MGHKFVIGKSSNQREADKRQKGKVKKYTVYTNIIITLPCKEMTVTQHNLP